VTGLRVRDLRAAHPGGRVAIEGITLHVPPGEVVAVVGPSGSGKTTMLRAIAGLVSAGGTIEIDGRDVTHVATSERNLAMVFEGGSLIPSLDVAQNLHFGLRLHRVVATERDEQVMSQARRLRLRHLLARKPGSLSAGESGRANIGRALVRRPSAWLLDEPLAHLDPVERFELRHRFVEEVRTQGVPALYVTHDPAEALAVGDRVAVLRNGRLVQVSTPRELYDRPVNAFVATFVTSQPVGLLQARVVTSGFQVGDRILPLWAGLPAGLAGYVDRRVVLALRAEDVADAAAVDDPDIARLRGIVVATEFTGPSVMASVELDAPPVTGPGLESLVASSNRARLTVRLPRDHAAQLESPLTLAVDAARAHVFDAETGEALWHGRPNQE
jgi:multiple sugar transport system ATP-binding protein